MLGKGLSGKVRIGSLVRESKFFFMDSLALSFSWAIWAFTDEKSRRMLVVFLVKYCFQPCLRMFFSREYSFCIDMVPSMARMATVVSRLEFWLLSIFLNIFY